MPHHWKHSRSGSMALWATWKCPCSSHGGWIRWFSKIPPTQTILWFMNQGVRSFSCLAFMSIMPYLVISPGMTEWLLLFRSCWNVKRLFIQKQCYKQLWTVMHCFHCVSESTHSICYSVKVMPTHLLQKEDVEVTLLPAGHCPGSVMYVLSILYMSLLRNLS